MSVITEPRAHGIFDFPFKKAFAVARQHTYTHTRARALSGFYFSSASRTPNAQKILLAEKDSREREREKYTARGVESKIRKSSLSLSLSVLARFVPLRWSLCIIHYTNVCPTTKRSRRYIYISNSLGVINQRRFPRDESYPRALESSGDEKR